MKFLSNIEEYLQLEIINENSCCLIKEQLESSLTILWFQENDNKFFIDGKEYVFKQNQIVFLTEFHKIKTENIGEIRFLRFNRPFYCVLDHDVEVGCKGLLFFGASELPIINLEQEELEKFEILWKMFIIEMKSNDSLQIEMLQMMLKRYLILCARIYKYQENFPSEKKHADLVREFNFLVEQHFKTKHSVKEYAELMFKSPKTLSNVFSKLGFKSPLQYIQNRLLLESKRLLHYSNLSIKEIAFEIGFEDIQTFSRFFKKKHGISPSEFKEHLIRE